MNDSGDTRRTKLPPAVIHKTTLEGEAFMALAGLRKNPEQIIAALLDSPYDIPPPLRSRIAKAFLGTNDGVGFKATGQSNTGWARTWHDKQAAVKRGREVKSAQQSGMLYEEAIDTVAADSKKGKKTIEADTALATRVDLWVNEKLVKHNGAFIVDPDIPWFDVLTWEYLYALSRKVDPDSHLDARFSELGGVEIATPRRFAQTLYSRAFNPSKA